jgi:hypothetical protein
MIGVPSDSDQTIIAPLTGTLESASTGLVRGKGRGRSQTPLILERLVSAAGRANVHLLAHLHVGATHRMPSASSGTGNLPGISCRADPWPPPGTLNRGTCAGRYQIATSANRPRWT